MSLLKLASIVGLIIYFAILLFAVARDKKNKNVLDYFFAGRTLPFWALSITFIASWWGAGSAISTADLAYYDGLGAFWYYGVPVLISTFLLILGAKAIRRVGYLTQGQMMEARYNKKTAKLLSFMIFIFMTLSAASQMVGIGTFFGTYLSLSYEFAIVFGTLIVLIYSMFGGFRGVVLTDIIQFGFLLFSAVAVFVVAFFKAGGLNNIAKTANALSNPQYMSIMGGASKYMAYVITFGCAWMIQANVWQRICAAKSDKDAQKMTVMSFFAYIPLYMIVVLTGMAGIVLFDTLPKGGVITAIVLNHMSPILGALVFVGIAAAIMSTMDSLINTGAMTLVLDLTDKNLEEHKKLKLSLKATLFVTCLALIISLGIRSILEISWIASDIITTGVFVPLIGGFFWRRGNSKGALASMITGLCYSFYNLLLSFKVPLFAFWQVQSALSVIIGFILSLFVYVIVSLCTKPEYDKADAFISLAGLFKKR